MRRSLGARPPGHQVVRAVVLGEVVGRGLALTGLGLLAGAVLSLGVSWALSGVLYEVRASDPRFVLAAMAVLAAAAAAAAWLPARRASRVDPRRGPACGLTLAVTRPAVAVPASARPAVRAWLAALRSRPVRAAR